MGKERVREGQDRENIDVHGRRGETEGGGGLHIGHAEGEKLRDRIFQGRGRRESRTKNDREEGKGLNRDQYICLVMYSRVNTLRMNEESPLWLHVLPKTPKASGKSSASGRDVSGVSNGI